MLMFSFLNLNRNRTHTTQTDGDNVKLNLIDDSKLTILILPMLLIRKACEE